MPLQSLHRWFVSVLPFASGSRAPPRRVESYPPSAWPQRRRWARQVRHWLGASNWAHPESVLPAAPLGGAASRELADARLDFADALYDVRTAASADALERIAVGRSLHELWHFREAVFSLVSCRHDQAEASRRLAALDRHFPKRSRPIASAVRLADEAHAG